MCKSFIHWPGKIARLSLLGIFFGFAQELDKLPAPQKWTAQLVEPQDLGRIQDLDFVTSKLSIRFRVFPNVLSFALRNWGEDSLFLLWNDCEFKIEGENVGGIVHSKLKFEDRSKPLTYQTIPPGIESKFFIAPLSKSDWNRTIQKWRSFPIYEGNPKTIVGKTFLFNLVMQDSRGKKSFPFQFKILEVEGITWKEMEKELTQGLASPPRIDTKKENPSTLPGGNQRPAIKSDSQKKQPSEKKADKNKKQSPDSAVTKTKAPVSKRIKKLIKSMEDQIDQEYKIDSLDESLFERLPLAEAETTLIPAGAPMEVLSQDSLPRPFDASELFSEDLLKPDTLPKTESKPSQDSTSVKPNEIWIRKGMTSF